VGGLDTVVAANINALQSGGTLDIAAFEWNSPVIHLAVLAAHQRGVTVRMVVDDNNAMEVAEDLDDLDANDLELRNPDAQGRVFSVSGEYRFYEEEYALADAMVFELIDAGVPVSVDHRSGFMHNKFMIMNRQIVWTGSMNYTQNGVYRNNNNLLMLRSRQAVEAYEAEFNEMFEQSDFGSSRSPVNSARFSLDGIPVRVLFSPEDGVVNDLTEYLNNAESSIRFMAFSFTLDDVRNVLLARSADGVDVSGIFEVRGSETQFSELTPLFCAGMDVRQDGNTFTFHHKVFIIDERVVLTGSFNFSASAINDNDENMVIIEDPLLAAQYIAEFDRMMAQAEVPGDLSCN
jgi:phosphatidylserine/phosphatidylglycerophosphate/cardiolipin synthase-like enzyme